MQAVHHFRFDSTRVAVVEVREKLALATPSLLRVAALIIVTIVAWRAMPRVWWYVDAAQAWDSPDPKAMERFAAAQFPLAKSVQP